jgi:hypothetical protein
LELKDQIIEQEKTLLTYEVRHSVEMLKSLLSDEFREIGSSGTFYTLNDILQQLPNEKDLSVKIEDINFRMLSDSIAILTYKAFVLEGPNDRGEHSLRSSIWRNEIGKWKMIFHQGTNISNE